MGDAASQYDVAANKRRHEIAEKDLIFSFNVCPSWGYGYKCWRCGKSDGKLGSEGYQGQGHNERICRVMLNVDICISLNLSGQKSPMPCPSSQKLMVKFEIFSVVRTLTRAKSDDVVAGVRVVYLLYLTHTH
jgi:hypothetical protein